VSIEGKRLAIARHAAGTEEFQAIPAANDNANAGTPTNNP
jgi:hypothetical protein